MLNASEKMDDKRSRCGKRVHGKRMNGIDGMLTFN